MSHHFFPRASGGGVSEHSNDSGFLLRDHNAEPGREVQAECPGPTCLPRQQQTLVMRRVPVVGVHRNPPAKAKLPPMRAY